jgi:hypothetical protein
MRTTIIILSVVLFSLGLRIDLFAQETPLVSRGARVRISASTTIQLFDQISAQIREKVVATEAVIGTIAELTADTLKLKIVERSTLLAIPLATVKKLEISRGHIPRGNNILKSAGIGLLIGAGVGVLVGKALDDPSSNEMPASGWMLLGGTVGGGTGLVLGSVIGASSSTERWEKVSLEKLHINFVPRGDGPTLFVYFFDLNFSRFKETK